MIENMTMRDAFWNSLYNIAKGDRNVLLVVSDMGAPALDQFKLEMPDQVINVGIAEQNAILIAAGLALKGKKPYVYSISSFLTTRCFEQIKLYLSGMNLPITLVGVGAGVCYAESGPTHHSLEDISTLRCLPNMEIYNVTDNRMAQAVAGISYKRNGPCYIRLDRIKQPLLYCQDYKFEKGLSELTPLTKTNMIATGNMVHNALAIKKQLESDRIDLGIIDAWRLPISPDEFCEAIPQRTILFTLEEHFLAGGMGSNICEIVMDKGLDLKVRRFGFESRFSYQYGDRECIQRDYRVDVDTVRKEIKRYINE